MELTLKVTAMEAKYDNTIGLTLSSPAEGTIFDHLAFLKFPSTQIEGVKLGDSIILIVPFANANMPVPARTAPEMTATPAAEPQ